MDVYAAAWLVADCAATLAERDPTVWDVRVSLQPAPDVQQFVPLSARFTALKDMAERLPGAASRHRRSRLQRSSSQSTSGASSTARCTASATSRRSCTWRVPSPRGFTRFMSSTTNSPAPGRSRARCR